MLEETDNTQINAYIGGKYDEEQHKAEEGVMENDGDRVLIRLSS